MASWVFIINPIILIRKTNRNMTRPDRFLVISKMALLIYKKMKDRQK